MLRSVPSPFRKWQVPALIVVIVGLVLFLVLERWWPGRLAEGSGAGLDQACQALRQSLGKVLDKANKANWVMASEVIKREYRALEDRYDKACSMHDNGEARLALVELGAIHAAYCTLQVYNDVARKVAELRHRFLRARDGLSAMLRGQVNGDPYLFGLFEKSELAWERGDWDVAKDGFLKAYDEVRTWIEVHGTKDDVNRWLRADAVGEMTRLQGIVNGQTSQIQELRKKIDVEREAKTAALREKAAAEAALAEAGHEVRGQAKHIGALEDELGVARAELAVALSAEVHGRNR